MSRISALERNATGAPGSTPPFDVEKSENRPTTPDVEWPSPATDSAMCAASRSLSNPRHRAIKPKQPKQPEQENLQQPAGVKPAGIAAADEQRQRRQHNRA
jgi:hypothetical protein